MSNEMKQNTHIDQLAEKVSIDTYELVLINAWYPFYRPSQRVLCPDTSWDQHKPRPL